MDLDVLVLGTTGKRSRWCARQPIPGVRGVYGGRLRNAVRSGDDANLIAINRRYKVHAGIRVTDL